MILNGNFTYYDHFGLNFSLKVAFELSIQPKIVVNPLGVKTMLRVLFLSRSMNILNFGRSIRSTPINEFFLNIAHAPLE